MTANSDSNSDVPKRSGAENEQSGDAHPQLDDRQRAESKLEAAERDAINDGPTDADDDSDLDADADDDSDLDADADDDSDLDADADDDAAQGSPADPKRAAFLDDLPDVEELRPLIASYVNGNYARLREQELLLRAKTKDPEVIAAARELVERTEPDPLSKALLGLSVAFFLFIVAWVYLQHGR